MRSAVVALAASLVVGGCGGSPAAPNVAATPAAMLPDVRTADGRPPVVLVVRDGDPAAAIAVAISTTGIGWSEPTTDDPEPATVLAGVLEHRLREKLGEATVTPSYSGIRLSLLATSAAEATRIASVLRGVVSEPITQADLAPAQRKLAALRQRPLADKSLARWARCVGSPHALAPRIDSGDLDIARLERFRRASFGLGRVAIAVTGPATSADVAASAILRGPSWNDGAATAATSAANEPSVDVFEASASPGTAPTLYLTLDVGTSSAAVTTAEALGDPHGPLTARLGELDLPFRVREVTGAAHARGGCVGVVLEASTSSGASSGDLAAQVADAAALVRLEAAVFLAETGAPRDGRVLSRRAGDARESAERAAWWALVDRNTPARSGGGSVVLAIPSRRKTKEAPVDPSREALSAAVTRRTAAWQVPVVEGRSRVESGQGETWVLVGSPCGAEAETEADSGVTALVVAAQASGAKTSPDVRIEPWVAADGAGLLVHGPALPGEAPKAHARRLADIAARSFAADPLTPAALARARSDLMLYDTRTDGATLSVLASALAPHRPAWIVPWGTTEPLARSSDSAVLLRAQALRSGPIRLAMLSNVDASQAEAAVRAADRWVPRALGGSGDARSCRAPAGAEAPKAGTYAVPHRSGSTPEAYLVYPFSSRDEEARDGASVVAAALSDGESSLLARALTAASAPGAEATSKIVGWPAAPALVVRVTAPQASLDAAVMQTRALVDRLHKGGLGSDVDRAFAAHTREALGRALDPRSRIVATWRGEPIEPSKATLATATRSANAFTQRYLGEDAMIVVSSRPSRPPTAPSP